MRTGTSTPTPEESLRLAPLDQVGSYGVAVAVVPAYPVGCVGGVYEGHNRHYSHHRNEQEPNEDHGQQPRHRPAHGQYYEPAYLVPHRLQRVEGHLLRAVLIDQPDYQCCNRP